MLLGETTCSDVRPSYPQGALKNGIVFKIALNTSKPTLTKLQEIANCALDNKYIVSGSMMLNPEKNTLFWYNYAIVDRWENPYTNLSLNLLDAPF